MSNYAAVYSEYDGSKLGLYKYSTMTNNHNEYGIYVLEDVEIIAEETKRSDIDIANFERNHTIYFKPDDGDRIYRTDDQDEAIL